MVSVIIPNYNHAPYLDERIQSVLNQTYQDFEVIIMDDCSTDNSFEIINKYKANSHISKIIVNEVNSGSTFKQWEKGIKLAKGDIIWIAESDDTCECTFLERLTQAIFAREDCVIAFCKIQSFDDNGKQWISTPLELKEGIYSSKTFISEFLSKGTTIVNASGAIFKKNVALHITKDYMDFKGAGDRLFWTKMAEQGTIAYIDTTLNYFRQHSNNSTIQNNRQGINQHEDKVILDYIYKKGYIDSNTYNYLKKKYIFENVLNIDSHQIRQISLSEWEPNVIKRFYLSLQNLYPSLFSLMRRLYYFKKS